MCERAWAAGLDTCLLVAPSTPAGRRAEISRLSTGFVYYLSVAGVTGARDALPADLASNLAELKGLSDRPVCVGFGLHTAAQVAELATMADGAIVGSAFVKRMTDARAGGPGGGGGGGRRVLPATVGAVTANVGRRTVSDRWSRPRAIRRRRPSPPAGPTDGQLVTRAAAGDRPAFDVLIRRYQRQAVAVSYRLLGNTPDALEVTQDAFLRALPRHRHAAAARGVRRVAVADRVELVAELPAEPQAPLDAAAGRPAGRGRTTAWAATNRPAAATRSGGCKGRELGRRLQESLAKLPEKQRQALVLFTVEELSQKDVAERLKCSVEAVKWHVFQGRKKLRELLRDELED